ncbi:SDR family NAD(P)-dependent oxidoreductase [Aerosticca soli]|jgi:NAD(P)-dependent dehydrogenase (short-subunit alcohol dehydrogenase family)|uniref:Oxidoreductase, short-chain dehydrogenase/reductase family n=1 Tax=Aerosticca soli TaxID=2010829 RepID=A0A2Z6E768_9GAMM|nr:SDR family NAD(P)-dependent oxidoreductase [Aerosticca soli]MDI3261476.1 SDR family NAD(P)-dependent oxidoreductase [Fulvimonas sp.]BBD80358.1 oxidoreductase, short-chain dehydrogenase/reductase family [Aerosticca soli]
MSLPRVPWSGQWQADADTLAGRVVLVTGAYGGLGAAVSRAAAAAGATVVISGRRRRALEQLYDAMIGEGLAEPVIHPLDLETATPRDYEALAEGLERDFGRLDGIVHAAASFAGLTPLAVHQPDAWLRTLHVNVSAPFALTQACLPLLGRADDSAVVVILDDPSLVNRAHWGAYGVAKAALERYVEILHQETERGPVRAHALLPPPMRTALRREAYFGENSARLPLPAVAAPAVVHLLAPAGAAARGALLDLRQSA